MWTPPDCESLQAACELSHETWVSLLAAGFDRHEASHILMGQPMCCEKDEDPS